jgi:hypothetical protein
MYKIFLHDDPALHFSFFVRENIKNIGPEKNLSRDHLTEQNKLDSEIPPRIEIWPRVFDCEQSS